MRSLKYIQLIVLAVIVCTGKTGYAGGNETDDYLPVNDAGHPCVSMAEYREMEERVEKNCRLLGLENSGTNKNQQTALIWPMIPAPGFSQCGYFYVSAFVDQNTNTGQIQDWNCGTRTYDGHRGIDIVPWPFIWDNMDNNHIHVIAAAAGTIVDKVDNKFDRVCNPNGSEPSNYVVVQHADGSRTLYIHLKTGSLTTKSVGASVSTGEYIGVPGSAGQSTGVHLHFEVRSDGTFANYIDPHFGACNSRITSSWWSSQKPYAEPEILRLSIHEQWPYAAVCPNTTDTLYEKYLFTSSPGAQAIFYASSKHVTTGMTWNFKILNPNNTVFSSWDYTSASTRNTSTLGFTKTLPTQPGIYTYQGIFNGITCEKKFTIQSVPTGLNNNRNEEVFSISPNPVQGNILLNYSGGLNDFQNMRFTLYNALGQSVLQTGITGTQMELPLSLPSGIYLYQITEENIPVQTGKLVAR